MLQKKIIFILTICLYLQLSCGWRKLDSKVITAVRHGLEKSLNYIQKNLFRSVVDACLGVAMVKAFMNSCYKNGTHVMDHSTWRIRNKCDEILEEGKKVFGHQSTSGSDWKFRYLMEDDIWTKDIPYNRLTLIKNLERIPEEETMLVDPDNCLKEIVQLTKNPGKDNICLLSKDCVDGFFKNTYGNGFYLTHKLLLLQISKRRRCSLNDNSYKQFVKEICSNIMYEISNSNAHGRLQKNFDLFLEQVLLCGYEGFTDFIQNNWLYHILKAQQISGCFRDNLIDGKKTRIRRDMTYFEDGCNEHTTTLAAGVLGLYYNFIINQEVD